MSTLKLATKIHPHFSWRSWRRPWFYASAVGIIGATSLAAVFIAQHYVVAISPTVPQAEPGVATSNMLASFNAQTTTIQFSDNVTHSYLAGHGAIFGLAGDNVQMFEYSDPETARQEASAIFKRVPWLAAKSYFHVFLSGNLIGLYIGSNPAVLQVTEETMGAPLANPG